MDSSGILSTASTIDNEPAADFSPAKAGSIAGGKEACSNSDSRDIVSDSDSDSSNSENAPIYSLSPSVLIAGSSSSSSSSRIAGRRSREFAISTAVRAVKHATLRDGFSGGYINVLEVNSTGIHHILRVDSNSDHSYQ